MPDSVYISNTPDYLILTSLAANPAAGAANGEIDQVLVSDGGTHVDVNVIDGLLGISNLPYKVKYSTIVAPNGGFVTPAAAVGRVIDISFTHAASTTYEFYLQQTVDGNAVTKQFTYTTPASGTTVTDIRDAFIDAITSLADAGQLDLSAAANGNDVRITADTSNPYFNAVNILNTTATQSTAVTYPQGQGADLLAEGVVDINGNVPVSGTGYYALTLDFEADRQPLANASRQYRKSLVVLVGSGVANRAAFVTRFTDVLAAMTDFVSLTANTNQFLAK